MSTTSSPLVAADAVRYGGFVDVAYDMYEADRTNIYPRQPDDFPNGFHITAWIVMSDFAVFGEDIQQFYGFVARCDSDPYQHVIAVRGTEGWVEWWDDAVFLPTTFEPAPSAGLVHGGFYRIYRTMRVHKYQQAPALGPPQAVPAPAGAPASQSQKSFADQVEDLLTSVPAAPRAYHADGTERKHHFVVTGHSLGAALCTLYVMEHAIKKRANPKRQVTIDRLCTFASPRVGRSTFVDQFNALPIDKWRIANTQDIVPKVPPSWLCGYRHVNDAYEFSSAGQVRFNPSCWHSMLTYLHWLDPSRQVRLNCKLAYPSNRKAP
jgi:hypothetical protein